MNKNKNGLLFWKVITIAFFGSIALFQQCTNVNTDLQVNSLTVEGRDSLLGSDIQAPRLSWKIRSNKRDVQQVAYQIWVASSRQLLKKDSADLWNSGKVSSDSSLNVVYKGKALASYLSFYWKVKVWTNKNKAATSQTAGWSTGLMPGTAWMGKWIGLDGYNQHDRPDSTFTRLAARYLRKEFKVEKKISSATVYLSGMGLYELSLNGQKVGIDVLTPTVSEYNKKIFYNTYDLTKQIEQGTNCLGVILGNGRYFGMRNFHGKPSPLTQIAQANYGLPQLIVQLRIQYADGTVGWVYSDKSWKVTDNGPILANNEYDGETYNANKELTGWNKAGYDESHWQPADLMSPSPGKDIRLVAQPNENIRVKQVLQPISVHKTTRGTYILDMGQNMVGWLAIKVKGEKGDTVQLRFAETLKGKDSLNRANLRDAKATDTYVLKGEGIENWEPKFTYHGFRYVEIEGLRSQPDMKDFVGKVVYDDIDFTSQFETSDSIINAVYKNASWTIRGNYRGMPTDCPQRDERVAWLGDRVISSYGESFLFDNSRLYAKWLDDIQDAQKESGSLPDIAPSFWTRYQDNVTYPSAFIIIPEMLRKQFGDNRSYARHYPAMKKWILYLWNTYRQNDLVLEDTYGDWCVPPESVDLIWSKDPNRITDGGLLASAYYYYCLDLMKSYAQRLNKEQDVKTFDQMADKVLVAFNQKFYHPDSKSYGNNTVTANLLPLTFGMVPKTDKAAVFENIRHRLKEFDNHVNSGIIGGMWLMRGLSDNGAADLAYKLATNTTYPSWGYMVEQGATTIWELWNGDAANPMMNSGNHQMLLGDLLIWYYEYLAGIKTDTEEVAFKKIIMDPVFPKGLDFVKASLNTKYGLVKSSWKKSKTALVWDITIPPGSSAEITLPAREGDITESGERLSNVPFKKEMVDKSVKKSTDKSTDNTTNNSDKTILNVGSGTYHFIIHK